MRTHKTIPFFTELTVSQAAGYIDSTEEHINRLLDNGDLEYRQDGEQRLVHSNSLMEFQYEQERNEKLLLLLARAVREMKMRDD